LRCSFQDNKPEIVSYIRQEARILVWWSKLSLARTREEQQGEVSGLGLLTPPHYTTIGEKAKVNAAM
jgi:hypothetical protein